MATCEICTQVDVEDILNGVPLREEGDFLLEALETFNPKNVNAALHEYFESQNKRVTEFLGCENDRVTEILDCVDYFEEERTLRDILERFDPHNVNATLREYFGSQPRAKIPDFVDAEKL